MGSFPEYYKEIHRLKCKNILKVHAIVTNCILWKVTTFRYEQIKIKHLVIYPNSLNRN